MKVIKAYRAPLYTAQLKVNCKKLVYNEVAYKTVRLLLKRCFSGRVLIFKAVSRDLRFGGLILMRMKS